MTCKDCIFWEMCVNCNGYDSFDGQSYLFDKLTEQNETEIDCKDFKNKDEYQKVIHAKWEFNTSIGKDCKCSNCYHEENFSELTDYCSSCGAKMDLE